MENKPTLKIDGLGTKRWYLGDKPHREDGPAIEYANGHKQWCKHGEFHRKDGPAIEYADGTKVWYINGKRHRLDGPAAIYVGGNTHWYINDYPVTPQISQWAEENNIDLDNLTEVDKALIKLIWVDYGK